jgi:hypothetical protein
VAGAPLIVSFVAITCLHIYQTPAQRNRRTALTLLIFAAVILLLNLLYARVSSPHGYGKRFTDTIAGCGSD